MYRLLVALLFSVALIAGCSSSTTPTTPTNSYMASTTGSYLINQNVELELDTATGEIIGGMSWEDSTVVISKMNVTDAKGITKNAVMSLTYSKGEVSDTTYMAEEGAKIYLLAELNASAPGVDGPNLGMNWILVADQNATATWTAFKDSLSNVQFDYNGTTLTGNVAAVVTGSKKGNESLAINGASVEVIKYTTTYNITMYIDFLGSVLAIPISFSADIWMGKGIGLVKVYQPPVMLGIPAIGVSFPLDGISTATVRYSVAG